jgi:hypothetical protein
VRRDIEDLWAYYGRYQGFAQTVGSALNDSYLKANRVEGGIEDYRRAWRLIIAQARLNEGRVLPVW